MASSLYDWEHDHGVVNLALGAPDKTLLTEGLKIMSRATKELLESGGGNCLQYGPEFGDTKTRKELAKFLTDQYKDPVEYENLIFNAGATQGLTLLTETLMQPGDTVFVEDPSYRFALILLRKALGMNLVPVPTDQNGIVVEELDKLMVEYSANSRPLTKDKPFNFLVYIMPTFNNPSGSSLCEERSARLVKVLRKHKAMAVCDDVYNTLYFDETKAPPKRLFSFDNKTDPDYQGNVFSNCTFTKILGPGLRFGWIEGPTHHLPALVVGMYPVSGFCYNHYTACIIGKALELGIVSNHMTFLRKVYHSRMTALCAAIDKYIPSAKYTRPKGSFFVWLEFPANTEGQKVFDVSMEKYKVGFHIGSKFSCAANFPNHIRLSTGFYPEEILHEAVRKIGRAYDEVTSNLETPY